MSASPLAAAWIAWVRSSGPASLSRKPRAPALSAPWTYSSRSKVVITTTAIGSSTSGPASARVASSPLSSGMRMSNRHTSGRSARARRTASRPSRASAITSIPGWASRIIRSPDPDDLVVVGDEHPDAHGSGPPVAAPRRPPSRGPGRDRPRACRPGASPVPSCRRRRSRPAAETPEAGSAVVADGQPDGVPLTGDEDRDPGRVTGVTHRVGDGLLGDPVGRGPDRRR